MRTLLLLLGVVVMIGSTSYAIYTTIDHSLLAGPAQESTFHHVVHILVLVLCMTFGMLSSFLSERLGSLKNDQVSLRVQISKVVRSGSFLGALVVAPLVFNGLYVSISQNPQGLTDFVLAYQNGFFWQAVLARVKGGST